MMQDTAAYRGQVQAEDAAFFVFMDGCPGAFVAAVESMIVAGIDEFTDEQRHMVAHMALLAGDTAGALAAARLDCEVRPCVSYAGSRSPGSGCCR